MRARNARNPPLLLGLLAGIAGLRNLTLKYEVRHGTGVKLGPAITISALLIQGPFPTEDKADHEEHRRQVQSAMLNVLDDSRVASFY